MRAEQMQGEQQANAQRSPLTGRVAIVTGGGRGLGRAMVLGLAQAGVYVVATAARENAELETVAREAQQTCGEGQRCSILQSSYHRCCGWFRRIPTG